MALANTHHIQFETKKYLPPSTETICPVIYPAAGRHKKATRPATSSGSPTLPAGVLDNTDLGI